MKQNFLIKSAQSTKVFLALLFPGAVWVIYLSYHAKNDDAYIFYRYVHNIVSGNGWVYNPGEHINALTSTLYPILLSILGFLGLDIPIAGYLIYLVFLVLSVFFIHQVLLKNEFPLAAVITPLLFLFHTIVILSVGLETSLYIFLIITSIYYYLDNRITLTTILLGLLILTRYDGVLLTLVLFFDYVIRNKKIPYKSILILVVILLPWFAYSYFHFHTLLPTSMWTKMQHGRFLNSTLSFKGRFLMSYVEALPTTVLGAHQIKWVSQFYFAITLILAGIALYTFHTSKLLRLVIIWVLLHSIAYSILNVPWDYFWYWVPEVLLLSMMIGLGLERILQYVNTHGKAKMKVKTIAVYVTASIFILSQIYIQNKAYHTMQFFPRGTIYKQVGDWLNTNTPPNSLISANDIGIVGYYSDRPLIDLFGLVTPSVMEYYKIGNFIWPIKEYQPDYMVVNAPPPTDLTNAFLNDPELVNKYQLAIEFHYPQYERVQKIYKKIE